MFSNVRINGATRDSVRGIIDDAREASELINEPRVSPSEGAK